MSPIRVGLPRAMLYHKYGVLWIRFFQELGCQTVISPETNRLILEQGVRYSVDETCLAMKIYLGHIQYLIDKVDYIFIPRVVSLYRNEESCVKLFAMTDIVRNTFKGVNTLEYTVDVPNHQYEAVGLFRIGMQLTNNPLKVVRAYRLAKSVLRKHKSSQLAKQRTELSAFVNATRILVIAHSYVLRDELMGKTVLKMLREQGVSVLCADIVPEHEARMLSCNISTDLYWTYNKELLGAIGFYKPYVDGLIILMAFPCGPDALVVTLCQHVITDKPLCVLSMDELQADVGIRTRLESFVDIVRFKKEQGDATANRHVPAHG